MTQKRGASPPRNRPRKKPRSPWPLYLFGGVLVYLLFVSLGLHGLPGRSSAVPQVASAAAAPGPQPPAASPNQVSVKELPADTRKHRPTPAKAAKAGRPPAVPSPPAVSASQAGADSSAPIGTARVADDSTPAAAPADPAPAAGAGDAAPPTPSFSVDAGSFTDESSARQLSDRLAAAGYRPSVTTSTRPDGAEYNVQVGPFSEQKDADAAVRDLNQQGIDAHVAAQ